MSNSSPDRALNEAYELIEADKLSEAEEILKPILEQEPDNVDAWWLFAHAVTDPETARMSLNQVLRLDNSYEEAQILLNRLDQVRLQAFESETEPVTPVGPPPSLPDENFDLEQFEASNFDDSGPIFGSSFDDEPLETASGNRGLRFIPGILVILALIVAVILLVLNPFAGNIPVVEVEPTEPPTQVAQQVSTSVFPTPTAEEALDLPIALGATSENNITSVASALQESDLVSDAVGTTDTALGNTLLAAICSSTSGTAMREITTNAMNVIASTGGSLDGEVEAVGVALIDCDVTNSVLRIIAVPIETATAFNDGEIDSNTYQSQWVAAG